MKKANEIPYMQYYAETWGNSYITSLLLIITLRFTCGGRKIYSTIKKSQNIMNMILDK